MTLQPASFLAALTLLQSVTAIEPPPPAQPVPEAGDWYARNMYIEGHR